VVELDARRPEAAGKRTNINERNSKMRFKKTLLALVACMALAAFGANAAQASPGAQWTTGSPGSGPGTPLTGSATVNVSGGPWTLSSSVLGAPIVIHAEEVECSPGETCEIFGEGSSRGGLTYTGVTVTEPSTCSANSPGEPVGTITTNPLKDTIIMDPSNEAGPVFDRFEPASGTTFVEIELTGAECPFAGVTAPVTGSATGEASHPTGFLAETQELTFGSAQQATGGGELKLGKAAATLSGTGVNRLSGENQGKAFGVDG
jgi:hypothetical protein